MLSLYVQVQKIETKTEDIVIQGSDDDTEGATGDIPSLRGATNGNTATKGNTGGATKDATKSNTEIDAEISRLFMYSV